MVVWRPRSGGAEHADALLAGFDHVVAIAVEKVTVGGFPVALTVTVDAAHPSMTSRCGRQHRR